MPQRKDHRLRKVLLIAEAGGAYRLFYAHPTDRKVTAFGRAKPLGDGRFAVSAQLCNERVGGVVDSLEAVGDVIGGLVGHADRVLGPGHMRRPKVLIETPTGWVTAPDDARPLDLPQLETN